MKINPILVRMLEARGMQALIGSRPAPQVRKKLTPFLQPEEQNL